jgi:hypothetical protein
MTLVYTSKDGSAQSQLELSTPSQNVARPVLQDVADILTYPAPGGGLLRVPVGGGAAAPLLGTARGQIVFWDDIAGQWVVSETPVNGAVPVWSTALNKWVLQAASGVQSSIGWNLSAPITFVLIPAGHTPGQYSVGFDLIARTAATTASVARTYAYSAPTFGPTSAVGAAIGINGQLGHVATTSWTLLSFRSDGASQISLTLTPSVVTGAPVLDAYAYAQLVAVP